MKITEFGQKIFEQIVRGNRKTNADIFFVKHLLCVYIYICICCFVLAHFHWVKLDSCYTHNLVFWSRGHCCLSGGPLCHQDNQPTLAKNGCIEKFFNGGLKIDGQYAKVTCDTVLFLLVICAEQIKWASMLLLWSKWRVAVGVHLFRCCFSPPSTPCSTRSSLPNPQPTRLAAIWVSPTVKTVCICKLRTSLKE